MLAAFLALSLAIPPIEQLTLPSLPKPLAELLRAKLPKGDDAAFATFDVRRFATPKATLWTIGFACPPDSPGTEGVRAICTTDLYLQHGKRFAPAGSVRGELVEVDFPEAPQTLPDTLFFYAGGKTETRLQRQQTSYTPSTVTHRFRDPLTQETLTAAEIRARAFDDLKAGNASAAAGRFMLLCDSACEVGDLEALAAADLEARLFPQAETALRAALARPGHQAADWFSLAALLRAQGHNAEAAEAESHFAEEGAARDGGG